MDPFGQRRGNIFQILAVTFSLFEKRAAFNAKSASRFMGQVASSQPFVVGDVSW
jgi:hypothetical protein